MSLSILPAGPLQVLEGCFKVSPQPSLLQAEQPQLSQPFLIGEVFQEAEMICNKNFNNPKPEDSLYVHNVFSKSLCALPLKFFSFSGGTRIFGTPKAVERRLKSGKQEKQGEECNS